MEREQPPTATRGTGCNDPIPSDEDGHDSEEDRLMAWELERLREFNGQAPPLWASVPEFAGLTQATRVYALRGGNVQVVRDRKE